MAITGASGLASGRPASPSSRSVAASRSMSSLVAPAGFDCPLTAEQMAEQAAILAEIIGEIPDGPDSVSAGWADVSFHDHGGLGGPGFSPGSALDTLPPGPGLAAALDDTFTEGLEGLSDDQLAGAILAARRCES